MSNQIDTVVGKARIKIKKDGTPSKLVELFIYKFNHNTGEPEINKANPEYTYTDKKGKKVTIPNYQLDCILTIPMSTLGKVGAGEAKSCQIFYKKA